MTGQVAIFKYSVKYHSIEMPTKFAIVYICVKVVDFGRS